VTVTSTAPGPGSAARASGTASEGGRALADLVDAKGSTTVTVCLPVLGPAPRLAQIVGEIRSDLAADGGLVDEILVLDGGGATVVSLREARSAGARVIEAATVRSELGAPLGRGDLMWRSLEVAAGDVVVWLDPNLTTFSTHYVLSLVAPLLVDPSVAMVRATTRGDGQGSDGGELTAAVARPVLARIDPALAHLHDVVGGEYAGRRSALRSVPFEPDDGVEIGLLADLVDRYGAASIREVDLGSRRHAARSGPERSRQTRQVLRAALSRVSGPAVRGALPLRPPLTELDPAGSPGTTDSTTSTRLMNEGDRP
jgi:glucosyl-3-phosphoglycerate synthase